MKLNTETNSISLRSNASSKSVEAAQRLLREHNGKLVGLVEYNEIPTRCYLVRAGVVRWGCDYGFEAWGFDKKMVDAAIAGQKEFAYNYRA
jgi:hypothetical protein